MKKILSVLMLLLLSISIYAQQNVTKFLGIPIDGSKAAMIQKIRAKGFRYNAQIDKLEGTFNGKKFMFQYRQTRIECGELPLRIRHLVMKDR